MKIYREDWTGKKYFWFLWNWKIRINYWLYVRTPMQILGRSWETTKYDK